MTENCSINVLSVAPSVAPNMSIYSIMQNDKIVHAAFICLLSQVFRVPHKILFASDQEVGREKLDGN